MYLDFPAAETRNDKKKKKTAKTSAKQKKTIKPIKNEKLLGFIKNGIDWDGAGVNEE